MVTRLVSHKGLDLVKEAIDQLMREENVQFVVLGFGDWEYESFFKTMQENIPAGSVPALGLSLSFPERLRRSRYAADAL